MVEILKPSAVILCSVEQLNDISKCIEHLENKGYEIIFYPKKNEKGNRYDLIERIEECFKAIDFADLIVAIPKNNWEIGNDVLYEIAYANRNGRYVFLVDKTKDFEIYEKIFI